MNLTKRWSISAVAALAIGALLGWLTATGRLSSLLSADLKETAAPAKTRTPAAPARRPPRPSTGSTCRPAAPIRRRDQPQRPAVEAVVAAARRAAQGRAERAADHDRRRRLRRAEHLRRRHSDAGPGPHRQDGPALHAVPLHRALLADARRADHRPQPSLGRASAWSRSSPPASPATTASSPRTRRPSAASSRTTATPPRGSARTTTRRPSRPARSGRSTSGRPAWASSTSTASSAATPASGSRTCSATPRPSIPTSASPAGT